MFATYHQELIYLIIGGATRAGSTALFLYLADHPEICRSRIKETRFFLDLDYPLEREASYLDGGEAFEAHFQHCSGERIRIEATPDYLFSPGTSHRLRETQLNVRLIFLLRDPIERIVSWYQYASQKGMLESGLSLNTYIRRQLEDSSGDVRTPQYMWAVEQGRYLKFLQRYESEFPPEEMKLILHERMRTSTREVLQDLCEWLNISSAFFQEYRFERYNPSLLVRSPRVDAIYRNLMQTVRKMVMNHPPIRKRLRKLRRQIEPSYRRINVKSQDSEQIDSKLLDKLTEFYKDEYELIKKLKSDDV